MELMPRLTAGLSAFMNAYINVNPTDKDDQDMLHLSNRRACAAGKQRQAVTSAVT